MEKNLSIEMLEKVANGLAQLRSQVVFVGGATTSLYVDDPAVVLPRATDDIDCVIELTTLTDFHKLGKQLRALGFREATEPRAPLCRWRYSGITVDIMPTEKKILGFSNRWYLDGIKNAETRVLPSQTEIRVFSLPYFVASKLEAYFGRGQNAPRLSTDLEDVVYVLDGCENAEKQLGQSPQNVKTYIGASIEQIALDANWSEVLSAHLEADSARPARAGRIQRILENLK